MNKAQSIFLMILLALCLGATFSDAGSEVNCGSYGCHGPGGSCGVYGCHPAGGSCGVYGCHGPGGSCGSYGCVNGVTKYVCNGFTEYWIMTE